MSKFSDALYELISGRQEIAHDRRQLVVRNSNGDLEFIQIAEFFSQGFLDLVVKGAYFEEEERHQPLFGTPEEVADYRRRLLEMLEKEVNK